MNNAHDEIEKTLRDLTGACNIGILHPLDQERVVKKIWELAAKGMLNECDIPRMARDDFNWGDHPTNFLKEAIRIIDVLYPMASRGDITL